MKKLRNARRNKKSSGSALFEDEGDTIDILGLLGVLRRRVWLIGLITIACTGLVTAYGMSLTPTYTANASVLIQPPENNYFDVEAAIQGMTPDQATIATQIRLLQSRTYQSRVMEDIGLFEDPEYNVALRRQMGEEPNFAERLVSSPVQTALSLLPHEWLIATGLAKEPEPAEKKSSPELIRERAINIFSKNLVLENDGHSRVINISFTSEDAEKAARVANRTAEIYVADQLQNKQLATDRASGWLKDEVADLERKLHEAEEAVATFRAENYITTGQGEGVTLTEQELSELNRELIIARGDRAATQAKLSLVRELRNAGEGLDSLDDVINSPVIVNLRQQETDLLREEAELSSLYGERHPRMQHLRNEKQNLEEKVQAEVERIIRQLQNDLRVTNTRISTIEDQLGDVKSDTAMDRAAEVRLGELERKAETLREQYQNRLQRLQASREQLEIMQPDVRIVAVAEPPTGPSSPGPKLFAVAGFAFSFMFGSLLAVVLERLDRGIRSSKQVQAQLELDTIGLIPKLEKLKKGQQPFRYLMDKPLSSYAEAIRSIFTAIKYADIDHPAKVIMVTSSLPQEGKTTLAVSLATFAARSHKRVLLVDLDLRHPSVHRELGWQASSGLVEYMAGERALEEVIHHDLETGLHFLPIKGQTTNPTDLLDSQKMRLFIDAMKAHYDYVILDTAPLASVTDSRLASRLADKVVFVVKWGDTVASAAQDSVASLRHIGVEPVGVVLSQIDMKKHAQYGYSDVGEYYNQSQKYYVN